MSSTANPPSGVVSAPARVTVLVPAFNEALKLHDSLVALHAYLLGAQHQVDADLLVVNDGSTDATGVIADEFAESVRGGALATRVVHHEVNGGLGAAIRTGLAAATGDIIVVIDSDLSYSPDHIGRLVAALTAGSADIVIASPYMKGGRVSAVPASRLLLSRVANRMLSFTTGYGVKTVTGMVRAYRGDFIHRQALESAGPEISTEIVYRARLSGAKVVEIPAHLDWSAQAERIAHRRVRLRLSHTTRRTLFYGFVFVPMARRRAARPYGSATSARR